MKITLIPLLKDNYAYLLQDDSGVVAVVDPSEAKTIQKYLKDHTLTLNYIINTHHHGDHTGGNKALKTAYHCKIIGAASDAHRIEGLDIGVKDGDHFTIGHSTMHIIATPGHTSGHLCLYFPQDHALFCGDTLFAMGCGRLFEGTAEQMWQSLNKIMALPDETLIYCGHEYTQANGEFCLSLDPDNPALKERMKNVYAMRDAGQPTIPFSLKLEKQTNIFLRASSAQHFAELRAQKDSYTS